ncbi:thiamine-monophosphate kinase [Verrucomicrobium sp. GAS474]|uniref:thiamine-phosphate kinase n=1 Tax=Verrucomicrobium sp. GAS474 TaxID=1882831 RepID=UPI00087D19CE|nr:thiamine-phosphate kinase [Verrucomicrobium sp. GAS474]SDU02130.1 thiamine-monophosphate kinase [Verrucomicrobium sp. GAS474]
MNEDRFIAALTRKWKASASMPVGPGDDCAVVVPQKGGPALFFKTDAVVEGLHFTARTPGPLVGRKALARNLSDAAAMGGTPTHALVTLALPPGFSPARIAAIYRGIEALAHRHGVALAGGETTRSPKLLLSVTLLGTFPSRPLLRSGGRAGDDLWVTGTLGASLRGGNRAKHLAFEPRLAEGAWLAKHGLATAAMDLSDGLAADLPRLAKASRCGFRLDRTAIPRTPRATLRAALTDGEDYELLFAAPAASRVRLERAWKKSFPSLRLTRIGALTKPGAGEKPASLGRGYDHLEK